MTRTFEIVEQSHTEEHHDPYDKVIFGFWIYLMTDCVLFATLFATYIVLHPNTFGGPTSQDLFSLPLALTETLVLLTSTFTCGLAMLYSRRAHDAHVEEKASNGKEKSIAILLFGLTFLLGFAFLILELTEFREFIHDGNSWQRSAFLSSYFTLVGCHGLHITCGLIWIAVMIGHIIWRGFTSSTIRRLACLSMFWHFLDVVWVFIFTIVYLMGVK